MQKRISAIGVIVVGVVMLVAVFSADLFNVAPAFEDLTDGFRDTVMSDEAITQARTDIAALEAVGVEFEATVVPTLAGALEMDAETFTGFLGSEFPAVATGAQALPTVTAQFTDVVNLIASQQANFEAADAIPTDSIPATTVPYAVAGIGILSIIVGALMFMRGSTGAIVAMVLGLVVVASTVVLALVDKSGSADDMNEAFKPVYTEELVVQSQEALVVVGAMGEEMQTSMMPALAERMGMTAEEVQGFIGESFPATAAALQTMPEALGRFQVMVGAFDAELDNYNTIKDTALTPIALTTLIGGIVIALLGLWSYSAGRNEEQAPGAETKPDPTAKAAT